MAKLFLGDVGSLPIGLLLGWLLAASSPGSGHLRRRSSCRSTISPTPPSRLLARISRGEPFWQAHRTHFYQRAIDRGFTVPQIVARVFLVNLALVALALTSVASPPYSLVSALMLAAAAAIVGWLLWTFARGKR